MADGWAVGAARYGLPPNRGHFGPSSRCLYYSTGRPVRRRRRRRLGRRAAETLATERWRDDLRRWAEETRPAVVAASRALLAVELGGAGRRGAGRPRRAAVDHFEHWAPEHFAAHDGADGAGGALIEAAVAWGLDPAELFEALAGAAGATASGDALLERIAAGLRAAGATGRRPR